MASNEYNLAEAFQRIENELMASMIRNMDRHRAEETEEGYNWSMWQAEQLKALEKYKRNNQRKYRKQFKNINNQIEELIRQARQTGNMQQEIRILQAIKKGWKVHGKNKSPAQLRQIFHLQQAMNFQLRILHQEPMGKYRAPMHCWWTWMIIQLSLSEMPGIGSIRHL